MPRATINISTTQKFELKTCPGGFVELRRMTFGDKLARQAAISRVTMATSNGKKDEAQEVSLQTLQREATLLDFRKCIADHNLTADDDGLQKLDFTNPLTLDTLDPRVGEEIADLIDEINNFADEEEAKN